MKLNKENVKVGLGCSVHGWSDSESYTVIKVSKTIHKITVQRDHAERLTKPEFIPGGFGAICVNNREIEYKITPNPTDSTRDFYANKNGEYCFCKKPLSVGRFEYYDYNF